MNWPYFYGGQFTCCLSKFYIPLTQNYTRWNLSHGYIHIYIIKNVDYNNIGKNQRLEAFYMLLDRGPTDLPHNGVLCSLRKEWPSSLCSDIVQSLNYYKREKIIMQDRVYACICIIFLKEYTRNLDVATSRCRWVGKRDFYFSV